MYAAIDVASAKVLRQLRKYKTRVIDHRMRETLKKPHPSKRPEQTSTS
ncbi:MAG: HPF/RaiA family ribosome-associated protein [Slackia sp.]